jgi:hypothetical protein
MPPAWTPGVERTGGLDPSKENSRNGLCAHDSSLAGQGSAGSCRAHSVCVGFTSVLEWGSVTRWRRTSENAQVIGTLPSTEMLRRQCWLFAIGSSLFAIGTAPGFAMVGGAGATNLLCFIGSWFFTGAALIQLLLSRPSKSRSWEKPSIRAEFLSAATQFVGTLRFNVSTGAALWAHRLPARRHFVWWPDATGSVSFLVSGALGVAAVTLTVGLVQLKSRDWQAAWINMIGSIAFGASAVGAFITRKGITEDALVANMGTFVGALCFLVAALLTLPKRFSPRAARA